MPPHDYPYHWVILDPKSKDDKVKVTNFTNSPKFQIFEFWNGHYTRHTFWSCLIRCANMKWIRWVLLKIQSGHDSVHRRTDGRTDRRTDKVIPVYPPINFVEAGGIMSAGLYRVMYVTQWWTLHSYGRYTATPTTKTNKYVNNKYMSNMVAGKCIKYTILYETTTSLDGGWERLQCRKPKST